jgi:D-glycero-D-manno-heptose 1,7-bisphosphate phosphatase
MIMRKAIFLDRDGVINDNSIAYYISRIEDFRLNPDVMKCLKNFYKKNYLLIIITNQGGVAKKIYTKKDVEFLNQHLVALCRKHGIEITEIYFCPHHSEVSRCICRKPESLLFEKAIAKYRLDANLSYMIGDSQRDVVASEKAGIKGIKVKANSNLYEALLQTDIAHLLD